MNHPTTEPATLLRAPDRPAAAPRRWAAAAAALAFCTATSWLTGCDDDVARLPARPWTIGHGPGGAGAGGSGGSGGAGGGTAGTGGTGGSSTVECLSEGAHEDVFTILQLDVCVVSKYDAALEVGFASSPTWGTHGGPLTAHYDLTTDEATISRWVVPPQPTGTLTQLSTALSLDISAGPVFFGAQAVDVPFYPWTLLSWTGDFGTSDGELIAVLGNTVAERWPVAGMFAAVGLGEPFGDGRVLHNSLTALQDAGGTLESATYAADFCGGPVSCGNGRVTAWGEANGPLATDTAGNVFSLQTWFSTNEQSLRAFEATTISPLAASTEGSVLLTMPGFGSELAAMGPTATEPGILFFQPYDGVSFEALDVIALPYHSTHTTVAPAGAVVVALHLQTPNTPVTLMSDHEGRLWVGIVAGVGQTTFYVLDRR